MSGPRNYPRPDLLADLPPGWAVLEASAGTGKTWTLEHLVVDLLLTEGLKLEQILVVTFGEKAAREMRERVRTTIRRLLDGTFEDDAEAKQHWVLDAKARAALDQALMGFDRAAISTIHAFCQRLLSENALLGGRPFETEVVKGKTIFRRALRERVRNDWAVAGSPLQSDLFEAFDALGGEEGLFNLLWAVHSEPGKCLPEVPNPVACVEQLTRAYDRAQVESELLAAEVKRGASCNSVLKGLDAILALATAGSWADLQTKLSNAIGSDGDGWLRFFAMGGQEGASGATIEALSELTEHLPNPMRKAVDLFLDETRRRAREIKDAEALLDYDDMLELTADALKGEGGAALAEGLRGRYRAALIDEFQDTSPSQWEIFRTAFQVEGWKLVLIGDPKQAIYGFRGGDIHTYLAAQTALVGHGEPLRLGRNYRSTPRMIDGYNRILDQKAEAPFFLGQVTYPVPVKAGRDSLRWIDAEGQDLPPVRLVRVPASQLGDPVARIRWRLARHMAGMVRQLLDAKPRLVDPKAEEGKRESLMEEKDIFVLTSTKRESALMAEALREVGVPCAFYKREGVFQSAEALDLLNVLKAIADPGDADRRARAWLTPVFGVPLRDLGACRELPETHPLLEQLRTWHALAETRRYPDLFRELIDGGLLQRLLRTQVDDRSAGIWMQLTEWALEEAGSRHGGFDALVARFEGLVTGRAELAGEDPDAHRVETDNSAVQILTMHKAKGLEAKVVVLFGGLAEKQEKSVHHFFDGQRRRFWVGKSPSSRLGKLARRERDEESQRLLYVAVTRAKAQMILPVFDGEGSAPAGNKIFQEVTGDPKGSYGTLNRRLRALLPAKGDLHFSLEDLQPRAAEGAQGQAAARGAKAPTSAITIPDPPDFSPLAQRARPVRTASFSSLSSAIHEYAAPDPEERPDQEEPIRESPPGGTEVGTCLHTILERSPLTSAAGAGSLESWVARDDIAAILDSTLSVAGLDECHRLDIARLAYLAMTARYELPGGSGTLEGLAPLVRIQRELGFLIRHPDATDFLDGSIDLLFEWQGRVYFADWKSNILRPDYQEATCTAYLEQKYELQFRIYTLAVCEFLGIDDEDGYEAGFGGGLYVFLRGLPEAGVTSRRPSWSEVQSWRDALARQGSEVAHASR